MSRAPFVAVILITLSLIAAGQANSKNSASAPDKQSPSPTTAGQLTPASNITSAKGFVLEDATPVKLRFNRTVSSANAHVGDTVDFEILQDISVNGTLVIPKGGLAFGTVTEAHPKKRMARGGKLEINLDYVKLVDSEKVAVRAMQGGNGGGHVGVMTAGIVATGLVFFPAAPFFLFMHGKDITIPKGAEVTAYINGDLKLNLARFPPSTPTATPVTAMATTAQREISNSARLQLESSPPGADIEVDGSYVGSTPSNVQVREGEHTVALKKAGFTDWERKIKVTSGSSVSVNAELEKAPSP
jgi:hypothetical protein